MNASLTQCEVAVLRESASQACALLKALANEDRLLLLCQLVGHERNVGELEALTGIRQPTLSQQLGVLRDEGLVATRRDGKYVYYQMASFEVSQVMKTLSSLYCGKAMDACTRNRNHDSGLGVFTPGPAAAGGLLIGAAAVLLMLGPGASPASAASSAICCRPRRAAAGGSRSCWACARPLVLSTVRGLAARHDRGRAAAPGRRRPAGRAGHALCLGLHQRPRRLRAVARFTSLAGGHRAVHGAGFAVVYVMRHVLGA